MLNAFATIMPLDIPAPPPICSRDGGPRCHQHPPRAQHSSFIKLTTSYCWARSMVSWTPQQLREWHEQCMDLLISAPALTYEQLAEMLGVHKQSVYLVVNSDLFQAKLRDRRERRQDKVDRSVLDRVESLAKASLDGLEEKIRKQRSILGLDEMRETAEMALRGLGYISNAPRVSMAPTNISVVIGRDDLAAARNMMQSKGELIDAKPTGT